MYKHVHVCECRCEGTGVCEHVCISRVCEHVCECCMCEREGMGGLDVCMCGGCGVCRGTGIWLVCDPREEKSSRLILLDDSGIFFHPLGKRLKSGPSDKAFTPSSPPSPGLSLSS